MKQFHEKKSYCFENKIVYQGLFLNKEVEFLQVNYTWTADERFIVF